MGKTDLIPSHSHAFVEMQTLSGVLQTQVLDVRSIFDAYKLLSIGTSSRFTHSSPLKWNSASPTSLAPLQGWSYK